MGSSSSMNNNLLRRKNASLKRKLEQNRSHSRETAQKARTDRKEIARLQRRLEELESGMVFEECPECRTEVGICWDIQADGYKAYCPYCGATLMLCSECDRCPCDYNYGTGSCKHNPWKEGQRH